MCIKMATSGHTQKFIRKAVRKGIDSFGVKLRRSLLPTTRPSYAPLHHSKRWIWLEQRRSKVMKRKNWYCGNQDSEELTHENINRRKKAPSHRAGN